MSYHHMHTQLLSESHLLSSHAYTASFRVPSPIITCIHTSLRVQCPIITCIHSFSQCPMSYNHMHTQLLSESHLLSSHAYTASLRVPFPIITCIHRVPSLTSYILCDAYTASPRQCPIATLSLFIAYTASQSSISFHMHLHYIHTPLLSVYICRNPSLLV